MKKLVIYVLLIGMLVSCKKSTLRFQCDIVETPIPAGDSAILFMPGAFTPNGDGLNDRLMPLFMHMKAVDFTVCDSFNNILFHTDALVNGWWEPEPSQENVNVYYYKIQAYTQAGNPVAKCGQVYAIQCYPPHLDPKKIVFSDQFNFAAPKHIQSVSVEQLDRCEE